MPSAPAGGRPTSPPTAGNEITVTSPPAGPPRPGIGCDMSRTMRHDRNANDETDPRSADESPPRDEAAADEADLADDDLADDLDDADETALEGGAAAEDEAPAEEDYASGPDDALGLYLRQMGAIPLLTRDKELSLAQKLERHRNRFRGAALLCPLVLRRVVEKFEQIHAGEVPLDPHVDVYSSEELKLSRAQILSRLGRNLGTLRKLLLIEAQEFAAGVRDEYPGSAADWRRARFSRLAKCRKLASELSPRTELLERWTDELNDVADELKHLVMSHADAGCPADRAKRGRVLREAM